MTNKEKIIGIITALVLILIGVLIYSAVVNKGSGDSEDLKLGEKQSAEPGKLIEGFDDKFLAQDAKVEESYRINYDGSSQFTTNQTSEKGYLEVVAGYEAFFSTEGFFNLSKNEVAPGIVTLTAVGQGMETYSVVIQQPDPNQKTYITINVVKR